MICAKVMNKLAVARLALRSMCGGFSGVCGSVTTTVVSLKMHLLCAVCTKETEKCCAVASLRGNFDNAKIRRRIE